MLAVIPREEKLRNQNGKKPGVSLGGVAAPASVGPALG